MSRTTPTPPASQRPPRRPYRRPRLLEHGNLHQLTLGGEGTDFDGAGGGFDFTGAEP